MLTTNAPKDLYHQALDELYVFYTYLVCILLPNKNRPIGAVFVNYYKLHWYKLHWCIAIALAYYLMDQYLACQLPKGSRVE